MCSQYKEAELSNNKPKPTVKAVHPVNKILDTYNCKDPLVLGAINESSLEFGVEPEVVAIIIAIESSFRGDRISRCGAKGYMQVKDYNLQDGESWRDTNDNIRAGVRYYRQMLDRFGSRDLALAAYNAGPSRVDEAGGVPDIPETKEYIRRFKVILREALG
jgi:soluble lytic murein transglycosylase-like protein